MKLNWLANLHARTLKFMFYEVNITGTVLFITLILLAISCDKSDDIETISEGSPNNNESPDGESETDGESQTDEEPIILYTDLEPDFNGTATKNSYNLDLNNDEIIDFTLSSSSDNIDEWLVIASNSNEKNGIFSVAPWYAHPLPLNTGEKIFDLRGYRDGEYYETWGVFNIGRCFGGDPVCSYDWKNKVDKHLGLMFNIKGKMHYGWVRIDVSSPTQWVIKDYAYNATPNSAILAGQVE